MGREAEEASGNANFKLTWTELFQGTLLYLTTLLPASYNQTTFGEGALIPIVG